MTGTKLLTQAEVADRLGVSITTVSRMLDRGDIAHVRAGSHRKITERAFREYIENTGTGKAGDQR